MARPRFSQMLIDRRHQLGLSVTQASKVLKLREDVLIAFEEGDFGRMPQSGYAQGMLSSYARYLGLNAREVTDLFMEDYFEFKNGTSSHELRRRTRDTQSGRIIGGYDVVNEQGSRPKAYVEYRPLLPTGGGPAGDIAGFTTTTDARPHRSVPLAGTSSASGTRGYAGVATGNPYYDQSYTQSRPYNAGGSVPSGGSISPSAARRRANVQGRRQETQHRTFADDGAETYADARGYRRDDVSTRRVRAGEFADDRRFDDQANPYAPASTVTGRRSSRNIASVERPNVRRRQAPSGTAGRGRSTGSRGSRGSSAGLLTGPNRSIFLVILAAAVALTAILVFSVSSCVNSKTQTSTGQTVAVNSADGSSSGTSSGSTSSTGGSTTTSTDSTSGTLGSSGDSATDSAASDATDSETGTTTDSTDSTDASGSEGDQTASETPTETVVEVSLEQGAVSFLEITCDGQSMVADTVTGPWRQSYTVTDKIQISATKPEIVTVTNNGTRVEFSTKSSGRGTISIEGTPAATDDAATDASADDTTTQE